jgi:FHA domain
VLSDVSPGVEALLGRLFVHVVSPPFTTFEPRPGHPSAADGGPRPIVAEIRGFGAIIGRGTDADHRLVGPGSEHISRRHLLVRTSGRQWTVMDCGSENHTYEEDPDSGTWRELAGDFPIPAEHGLLLLLGPELILRFELLPVTAEGPTTAPQGSGARAARQRIRPLDLENAAAALLSLRRADARDRRVPSIPEMMVALNQSKSTVHRRLQGLRELDEVAAVLIDNGTSQTADALEIAFPYLLADSALDRI